MIEELRKLTRKEDLVKDYETAIKSLSKIEYSKIITSPFGGEEEIIYRGDRKGLDYKIGYDLKNYDDDLKRILLEGTIEILSWKFIEVKSKIRTYNRENGFNFYSVEEYRLLTQGNTSTTDDLINNWVDSLYN